MSKIMARLSEVGPYLFEHFLAVKDEKDRSEDTAYINEDGVLVLNLQSKAVRNKIADMFHKSVLTKESASGQHK